MILVMKKPVPLKPEEYSKALKRFEWLITFLICNYRFVHTVLGMLKKIPKIGYKTIGVRVTSDGKFEMIYDPAWFNTLSDEAATYIFYHEITHLVLHHCTRRKFDNHELGNIAYDLAVNELIPIVNGSCEPPKNKDGTLEGLHVSEFKKNPLFNDIEERQSAEWYYDYLMKKGKDQEKKKESEGEGSSEKDSFDNHDGWEEHEVADERVSAKVREIDQKDLWGNVSQTNRELILAAQVKKINWRNKIRVWFGNMAWKFRQSTRKKPNRRTGYIHPGSKKNYVDRWLIAADTSGSIESDLLAQWLGIVNQLAEELPIDFMQFDCEKTEDPKPFNHRQLKLEFKGRGGTNFQPVIDIANKMKYKGLMILTDGEAGEPTKPIMTQVLWVLPVGKKPPVDWGERVYLIRHI